MNSEIQLLDAEELASAAGGAAEGYYTFIMNLYRGNTYDKRITVSVKPHYTADRLKHTIHSAEHVPFEKIHVYRLDGWELQYDRSFFENSVQQGTILKAVIEE